MKLKILALTFAASIVLAACNGGEANEADTSKEKDIKQLVSDYSGKKLENETASITSQQLIVTDDDGNKEIHDLSGEDFFVSIAPYENQTHP